MNLSTQGKVFSKKLDLFWERILAEDKFVLTTHIRPDADGWGSQLGMAFLLKELGKDVCIYNQDTYELAHMDSSVVDELQILIYTNENKPATSLLENSLFISLDNSAVERLGELSQWVKDDYSNLIMLDHHDDIASDSKAYFIFPNASSTSEILCLLLIKAKLSPPLGIANALYRGIVVDSGFFKYRKTTPTTHRVVAHLLGLDVKPAKISTQLYSHHKLSRIKARQIMYNSIQVTKDSRVAWMSATLEDLTYCGVSLDELDGLIDELLEVEKILVSALFTQRSKTMTRVSLRTREDYDILKFAIEFGKGGGHKTACGMVIEKELQDCIHNVIPAIENFLDKI